MASADFHTPQRRWAQQAQNSPHMAPQAAQPNAPQRANFRLPPPQAVRAGFAKAPPHPKVPPRSPYSTPGHHPQAGAPKWGNRRAVPASPKKYFNPHHQAQHNASPTPPYQGGRHPVQPPPQARTMSQTNQAFQRTLPQPYPSQQGFGQLPPAAHQAQRPIPGHPPPHAAPKKWGYKQAVPASPKKGFNPQVARQCQPQMPVIGNNPMEQTPPRSMPQPIQMGPSNSQQKQGSPDSSRTASTNTESTSSEESPRSASTVAPNEPNGSFDREQKQNFLEHLQKEVTFGDGISEEDRVWFKENIGSFNIKVVSQEEFDTLMNRLVEAHEVVNQSNSSQAVSTSSADFDQVGQAETKERLAVNILQGLEEIVKICVEENRVKQKFVEALDREDNQKKIKRLREATQWAERYNKNWLNRNTLALWYLDQRGDLNRVVVEKKSFKIEMFSKNPLDDFNKEDQINKKKLLRTIENEHEFIIRGVDYFVKNTSHLFYLPHRYALLNALGAVRCMKIAVAREGRLDILEKLFLN